MYDTITDIAKRNLRVETLEVRNSDQFDFYDCSIWAIANALEEAYNAGRESAIADLRKAIDES